MNSRTPLLRPLTSALLALVVGRPRAVILGVTALTVFFALGFRRGLELDVSPQSFIERESPARVDFENTRRNFGDDQYLLVAVTSADMFAPESLQRLRELHDRVEAVPGTGQVRSLTNLPYARSVAGGASLEKLIPEPAVVGDRLEEARRVATSDRLYVDQFVSRDGRTAALMILFDPGLPTGARHAATARIYELARGAGFGEVHFAGDPFSQWRGTTAIKEDLRLFLPLTLLLIAVLLWLCFGSAVAVALPLVTIGIGLVWLTGLMALLGAHFTILALMLPTLLLAIGCSYMIHVLNQVGIASAAAGEGAGAREIVADALRFIALPVVVSALTIIAGFLSLTSTTIPAIRSTSVWAALGAAFTLALSLTFVPAALILLDRPGRRVTALRVGLGGRLTAQLERLGRFATSHQPELYLVTAGLVVASVVGIWRIKIDIDYFHFFKPNSETSIGLAEIGRRLAGGVCFDIVIEGGAPGAVETPEALGRIQELQSFAEHGVGGIDRTLSIVDFLTHLNRAFHDNDPRYYAVPAREAIPELLSERGEVRDFITDDGRSARVLVRSRLSGSSDSSRAIAEVERRGRELLPGFRVFATGTVPLMNRTSDTIAGAQLQSVTIALLTIYAMLALLFRSWRVGLTALVPNLLPILFFFGFMGWRGIPLNMTTSLVASVVLGLAVDNAVQFVVRFRRVLPESRSVNEAIIQSMRLSGRPIIYANVALAAAFAIFALSSFEPIGSFGLLSAVTILACLVEDLILLPARLTSPVFAATAAKRPRGEERKEIAHG